MTKDERELYIELLTTLKENSTIRDWGTKLDYQGDEWLYITLNNGDALALCESREMHMFAVGLSIGRGF